MVLKEFLRNNCPNIPWLKKLVTKSRIQVLESRLIPQEEVLLAEHSMTEKHRVVEKYKKQWPSYSEKLGEVIEGLLSRAEAYQGRSNLDDIRIDMFFCRFAYGFLPDEYLYMELEGKDSAERRTYVSDMERIRYQNLMNDPVAIKVFKDKEATYKKFSRFFKREAVAVSTQKDWSAFERFVTKHPVFVKKPVYASCGHGVELVNMENCGKTPRELFDEYVSSGKMLLEEVVVQSEKMAVYNASSVNTVRCFTFNTRDGVVAPFGFLRTGSSGAFVDNAGSGGIFSALDTEKGVVITDGCNEMGGRFVNHPSSGKPFVGFEVPEWNKAISLCTEMAQCVPSVKFIGWDLAYTDNGWVLIEGNGGGQLVHQGPLRYGIKEELEIIMSNMDLML